MTLVLATWLGLLVLTRGRRPAGAWTFAGLCLLLVVWSVAIIIQRIGTHEAIHSAVNLVEDTAAFLLPALTLQIALLVAIEGRRPAGASALLLLAYGLAAVTIVQAAVDPAHPIVVNGPNWSPFGIPGAVVGWAFILVRAVVWAAAIGYLVEGLREAGDDHARQQQLKVAIATMAVGVLGAMLRILPEQISGPAFVGVSIIAIAMIMAAYTVLAQHLFLAADITVRAIRWSLLAGLAIVGYVAVLLALDRAARDFFGLDFPLVIAMAVVVTIALFDPVTGWIRDSRDSGHRELARARLQRALGSDAIISQQPEHAVVPVLARLARTFDLSGARVADVDGVVQAAVGQLTPHDPLAVGLPLNAEGSQLGVVMFGRKRNGLAFTPDERDALRTTAAYLSAALRLGERQHEQATALSALRDEGSAVESRGSALGLLLADATTAAHGLRVYALGPLRAERDGELVRRWGGAKAGSRQAEAVFAFLFDRGERGAVKDEILELIWPDVDLDRADVAFHRTMLGLRGMLRPDGRTRGPQGPITFHNDRYRLEAAVVTWSDVAEFERQLAAASSPDAAESLAALEAARGLYRGDFLDDCPFYGDSAQVEDRRSDLRARYVDLLIELANRYATRGDRGSASACLREAGSVAQEEDPRVNQALARLTAG
ncbi:MAG: hypothetical protein ACRDGD_01195 [Candidatus Limnocylindria bacterium]